MLNEKWLDEALSEPTEALIEDLKKLEGDIMILGAGGKIGPSLSGMAKRAVDAAGTGARVIAVSRFTDPFAVELLERQGVETISADLSDPASIAALPKVQNIIFMAGRKFGTGGDASPTWLMNTGVPMLTVQHFGAANYVVFSTGNVYPMSPVVGGGCTEADDPDPVGEYAMSSLGRERIFEYATINMGARALIFRLNYAIDLRYGVLLDIAQRMMNNQPVSITNPCMNCVWQGYVNEVTIRSLLHTGSPATYLNVTGPETASVERVAKMLGEELGIEPTFEGEPSDTALLNNAGKCFELFGYPKKSLNEMIKLQAEWIRQNGRTLGKPTHFEEKKGKF